MVTGRCTDVFQGIFLVWGEEDLREGASWEDLSMEEFVMGEENFNEGAQDFLALFKKQRKNKYEKVFSTESKEQH